MIVGAAPVMMLDGGDRDGNEVDLSVSDAALGDDAFRKVPND